MPKSRLVAPLLGVPILAGLSPLQITEIARNAERVRFGPGQLIVSAGSEGDGAYLIVSGAAECVLETGGEPVAVGSLIGEMAMLVEHEYRATVIARERVLCLKVTRAALHSQMQDDPGLARHFERHLRERLSRVALEMCEIDTILAAWAPAASQADADGAQKVA
jgi:CRP/FNR family transcriptional regulator, cyclic AMP receptor protein